MAQTEALCSAATPEDYGIKDGRRDSPMTPDTAVPPTPGSTWPSESLAEISDSDDEVIFQGSSGAPEKRSRHEEILADFEAQLTHLPAHKREIAVGRLRARMEESDAKATPEVQIVDTPPKGPNPRKLQVEDVVPVATPLRQKAKLNDSKSDPDAFSTPPVMKTRFSTPGRPLAETGTLSRMFFSTPSGSTVAPVAPAPQAPPVQAAAMALTPPMERKEKVNTATPSVSEPSIDGSVGATTPNTPVSLPKISSAIFGQRETVECFPRSLIKRRSIAHRQVAAKAKAKASMKVILKAKVKANKVRKRRTTKAKVKQIRAKAKAKAKISVKVPRKVEAKRAKEVARVNVPQAAPNSEAAPVDVVNNKASGGNAPMRMILAGEDALKTTSLKLPEIPALHIASTPQVATTLSDAGKESDDDMPLCALAELAPLTKLKRPPKSWAEQLRYPLESTQFPVRIYPSQESEEDLDDPWSSCSEPEEDDLLDREGRSVTELVWCR
mgnify:CR=1 FL=1